MKRVEKMEVDGQLRICIRDKQGRYKVNRVIHNTIPTVGKNHVADQMSDVGEAVMGWMAIGTGTPTTTALGVELDRNALTSKTQGSGGDANKVVYVGDWAAGDGTGVLTEAGIFNLVTIGGIMLASASFAAVNKLAADSLKITWTCTFG